MQHLGLVLDDIPQYEPWNSLTSVFLKRYLREETVFLGDEIVAGANYCRFGFGPPLHAWCPSTAELL
jgi:hypothetical protein